MNGSQRYESVMITPARPKPGVHPNTLFRNPPDALAPNCEPGSSMARHAYPFTRYPAHSGSTTATINALRHRGLAIFAM